MSRARGVRFVSFLRNKSLFFVVVLPGGQKKKKRLFVHLFAAPGGNSRGKMGKEGEMRENWDKSGKIEGWEGEKRNPRGLKRALLN